MGTVDAAVQIAGSQGLGAEVDLQRAVRSVIYPRSGQAYSVSGQTGAMAAALGANGVIFQMYFDRSAAKLAFITRILLDWAVSTAFTAPQVAGRGLAVQRAQAANPYTGGTALTPGKKRSDNGNSEFDAVMGGDCRIATTATLTAPAIAPTFEATNLAFLSVAGEGAVTNVLHKDFFFDEAQSSPIEIRPGEMLLIRNPAAMDAAGVWNLNVQVDWVEVLPGVAPVLL